MVRPIEEGLRFTGPNEMQGEVQHVNHDFRLAEVRWLNVEACRTWIGFELIEECLREDEEEKMRREAFFAGYLGDAMPRYNVTTSATCYKWFHLGIRWRMREDRKIGYLRAVAYAYHRNHAPRELEEHRQKTGAALGFLLKRRVLARRKATKEVYG